MDQLASRSIDILLVDDDESDIVLTTRAFKKQNLSHCLNAVHNGFEALEYLRKEGQYAGSTSPDLILLDLNMPGMDGREFLREVKVDKALKTIPVIVLTTSDAEKDILTAYDLHASSYVTKPIGLEDFAELVDSIRGFWFGVVRYPPK